MVICITCLSTRVVPFREEGLFITAVSMVMLRWTLLFETHTFFFFKLPKKVFSFPHPHLHCFVKCSCSWGRSRGQVAGPVWRLFHLPLHLLYLSTVGFCSACCCFFTSHAAGVVNANITAKKLRFLSLLDAALFFLVLHR